VRRRTASQQPRRAREERRRPEDSVSRPFTPTQGLVAGFWIWVGKIVGRGERLGRALLRYRRSGARTKPGHLGEEFTPELPERDDWLRERVERRRGSECRWVFCGMSTSRRHALCGAIAMVAAVTAGCGSEALDRYREAGRQGLVMPRFTSTEAAREYARAQMVHGRVDTLRIGFTHYLVLFEHGSGVPTTRISVYCRVVGDWELIAAPQPPPSREPLRAEARSGQILARAQRSGESWVIFAPK
jgi:hypothetical protein